MIRSFRHKGLHELFATGHTRRIKPDLIERVSVRLNVVDRAVQLTDLHLPGFNFHALHGVPKRYSIHVNGPWCLTFELINGDVWRLDLENYH